MEYTIVLNTAFLSRNYPMSEEGDIQEEGALKPVFFKKTDVKAETYKTDPL